MILRTSDRSSRDCQAMFANGWNVRFGAIDKPTSPDALALDGELTGYYRIKIDLYRVIYTIKEEMITIVIVRVAKRDNETYTGLPALDAD